MLHTNMPKNIHQSQVCAYESYATTITSIPTPAPHKWHSLGDSVWVCQVLIQSEIFIALHLPFVALRFGCRGHSRNLQQENIISHAISGKCDYGCWWCWTFKTESYVSWRWSMCMMNKNREHLEPRWLWGTSTWVCSPANRCRRSRGRSSSSNVVAAHGRSCTVRHQ